MVKPEIPAEVLGFLAANISSVPDLETLLVMSDEPLRSWTATEVAARVYVRAKRASQILELLQRRGLVAQDEAADAYRFSPAGEDQRALIGLVARTYRSNIVALTTFIHDRTHGAVMEFARAFDLKDEH